jgi:1-acyl-sn-glycerol-3-phosphate acyltransferase
MMARLRGVFLLAFWFTAIAILAPFLIALRLLTGNENMIYTPVRLFVRMGLAMVGVRVRVTGLEHLDQKQAYIFTPNHQSLIEVPLFVTYLGRNPGIGLMGVVPVDRSNSAAAVESARRATENLRGGKSYIVYPEGTRSRDGRLLPFKKGAFMMAIDAGVPVVPVTIAGATKIMPKGKVKVFPSTVHITLHEPVSTCGYSKENVAELVEKVRSRILSVLGDAAEQQREGGSAGAAIDNIGR